MSKKVEVDFKTLDALLTAKVTLEFCADYLKCSQTAIRRRIHELHGKTFSEYNALKIQYTGMKLQQKAISMALGGHATLLIFCLKNLAGWTDKQDVENHVSIRRIEDIVKQAKARNLDKEPIKIEEKENGTRNS